MNQNVRKIPFDQSELLSAPESEPRLSIEELELDLHRLLNINPQRSNPSLADNMADERANLSRESIQERRRNDWQTEQQREQGPKK